jgi:hypothetical protein
LAIQGDVSDFNKSKPLDLSCFFSDDYLEKQADFRELRIATHQDSEEDWVANAHAS